MATKKVTELTAATTLADTDLLPCVDSVITTPATKKITVANLKTVMASGMTLVETASPVGASSAVFSGIIPGTSYFLTLDLIQNTSDGQITITINSDTGSNYVYQYVQGTGASASSNSGTTTSSPLCISSVSAGKYLKGNSYISSVPGNNKKVVIMNTAFSQAVANYVQFLYSIYTGANDLSTITVSTPAGTITGTIKLYKLN